MIKDQQQKQQQGRNQPALVGESSGSQPTDVVAQQQAPPPAYTPNPVFQGLPMASSGQPNEDDLWHPPATMAEADRRARGRFIRALAVGFLIYVLALCLFGAPVEDSIEHSRPAPPPRHRHDRSGRPVITVVASPPPMPTGATAEEEPLTASVAVEQQ